MPVEVQRKTRQPSPAAFSGMTCSLTIEYSLLSQFHDQLLYEVEWNEDDSMYGHEEFAVVEPMKIC